MPKNGLESLKLISKMALKKWKTNFRLEHSIRKNRLPFQMFCCFPKFSAGTTQKVVFHLLSRQIFRKLWVNGKQTETFHLVKIKSGKVFKAWILSGIELSTRISKFNATPWFFSCRFERRNLRAQKLAIGGCPSCPKKSACCVIIHGFSGGSANPVWKSRVWNRWGTRTPSLWCQQRMLGGVVHRLHESLKGRSSSKLVEAVWVSERQWLLSLAAASSSFGWMPHHWRFLLHSILLPLARAALLSLAGLKLSVRPSIQPIAGWLVQ